MAENPGDILEEMGILKYFNIASQEKLLENVFKAEATAVASADALGAALDAIGLGGGGSEETPPEPSPPEIDPLTPRDRHLLSKKLMNINKGGRLSPTILKDDELKSITTLGDFYKVVYENVSGAIPGVLNTGASIKQIIGEGTLGPDVTINSVPDSPARSEPGLSAHLVQLPSVSPTIRHASAVEFFMNGIPPQEFSRCAPFLDIIIRTEGGRERSGLNTLRFLGFGPAETSQEDTIAARMASSVPEVFFDQAVGEGVAAGATNPLQAAAGAFGSAIASLGAASEEAEELLFDTSYTTMDVFTMPQSIVDYSNPSDLHPLTGGEILDRSRPFMSLKGMSVSHVSQRSATIYTVQVKLDLVLHDRSRLADVSQLIAPRVYKTTKFLIEYGWSHPDGGPESSNIYGRFLDSMRHRGTFFLVRSDYTFTQDGQVEISIILQNASSEKLSTYSVAQGHVVDIEAVKQSLRDAIAQSRTEAISSQRAADALPQAILRSENVTSNAMMLPMSVFREINSQINQATSEGSEISFDQVLESINNILDNASPPTDESPRSVFSIIDQKISNFKTNPTDLNLDPFLKIPLTGDADYNGIAATFIDRTKYVSFGKLVLSFLGAPIAASQDFDEVQIHFHAFNHSAGAFWGENISAFPVNLEQLESKLKRQYQTSRNVNVATLFDFMAEMLETPSAIPYGITQSTPPEASDESAVEDTGNEDDAQITDEELDSFLENRIRRLGCPVAGEFITPSIAYIMESLSVAPEAESDSPGNPGKTILRIHVTDTRQTPYIGETVAIRSLTNDGVTLSDTAIEESAAPPAPGQSTNPIRKTQNNTKNLVEETATIEEDPAGGVSTVMSSLTPDQMFKRIASSVPTFIYGSNHSAITSLDVRGSTTGPIADALVMQGLLDENRAANENPEEGGQGSDQGVQADLQLVPATITLNTLGCPLLAFGQQYFLSMGTGTTLEQVYGITKLTHTIGPGDFKSSATLYPTNSGRLVAQTTSLRTLRNLIKAEAIDSQGAPPPPPAPGSPVA